MSGSWKDCSVWDFNHNLSLTKTNTLKLIMSSSCVFQKKEWLCLNCQTQRLMSGGGLDEPPLPVPLSSPKHQPMGSPRHQPASGPPSAQQRPLHKQTPGQQQGPKPTPTQKQQQQPTSTAAKATTETKTITAETPKTTKTEEKVKTEPEKEIMKEMKKGEPVTPIKDMKKSKHYDVSSKFLSSQMI